MTYKTRPKRIPTPIRNKLRPCACSTFEIGTEYTNASGEPDRTIETTGCTRQTPRFPNTPTWVSVRPQPRPPRTCPGTAGR